MQRHHFAREFSGADFSIVEQGDGPIGRIAVDRRDDTCLHLVDIALLPAWRGRGIGAALIKDLIAAAGSRPVTLHVITENPARRLYQRLGFHEVEPHGMHVLMRYLPI
jgi:ribosomal protein S18 acetylase RimI-like enzyme